MIMKVFIDPGHGGSDSGACANGIREKDINLTTALKVKEKLEAIGIGVCMSRETDIDVGLDERCVMSDNFGSQLTISIHHNAGGGIGYEVIHSYMAGKGTDFANILAEEFAAIGQVAHGRGTYSKLNSTGTADYFALIREPKASSVIGEYAFLDSDDVNKINTDEGLEAEAHAYYIAICKFFNIDDGDKTAEEGQSTQVPVHWAKQDNDELLQAGFINSDHTGTLDNSATEGMVLHLINELRKGGR